MRFLCAAFFAALLPMVAAAVEENPRWRVCNDDAQCVLIQGTCDKTAVNAAYADEATRYYAELATRARCAERFWMPKDGVAQCKPTITVKGQEPVGNCKVVGKPPEKK